MQVARLMYMSKARPDVGPDEIHAILDAARPRNARQGVTGLLIFAGGYFLQLLEGPEAYVGEIFDAIRADPRHSDVVVLLTDRADRRQFPGWSMGFELIEDMPAPRGSGWFQLAPNALDAALPDTVAPEVRMLFTSFHAFNTATEAA